MNEKNLILAPCGIDCIECPAYKATRENDYGKLAEILKEWAPVEEGYEPEDLVCDGCHGPRTFKWCGECSIRLCGLDRGLENCAQCRDYPCEKLEEAWGRVGEGAAAQRANLEGVRGG